MNTRYVNLVLAQMEASKNLLLAWQDFQSTWRDLRLALVDLRNLG